MVDHLVDIMEYNVNQPSSEGKTALQFALENNHLEVVKVLLRLHAAVNEDDRNILAKIDDIQEFYKKGISTLE